MERQNETEVGTPFMREVAMVRQIKSEQDEVQCELDLALFIEKEQQSDLLRLL